MRRRVLLTGHRRAPVGRPSTFPAPNPAPAPTAAALALAFVLALAAAPAAAQDGFTVDHVLSVRGARVSALSDDGRWAVVALSSLHDRLGVDHYRTADPTYVSPGVAEVRVVDTGTGEARALFPAPVQLQAAEWSPDGGRLAVLVRAGDRFEYRIWERERNRFQRVRLPGGLEAAVGSRLSPVWTRDGATLVLPLRAADWAERAGAAFRSLVDGPVVVMSSADPFLGWEAVRRMAGLHVLAAYDVATGRAREVLPETMLLDLDVTADGRLRYTVDITEKTDYARIMGTDGRVVVRGLDGGEPVVVIENTEEVGRTVWMDDGVGYAMVRDGRVYVGHVDDDEDRLLLGARPSSEPAADSAAPADPPVDPDPVDPDRSEDARPLRFSPGSFSPGGSRLVASASGAQFFVDVATGDTVRFLDTDPDDPLSPSHRVVGWLGEDAVLVQRESRTEWRRELLRYGVGGDVVPLHETGDLLQGVRLSRDGSTVLFEAAPSNRPTDLFAAGASLRDVRRLVQPNPSLDPAVLARTELVSYLDADGRELHGVLYYPLGYVDGERYPTILHVYESFYDPRFDSFVNVMTSNGYAVMRPSVRLERGYPGEAWLKGVTAAANELIRRGIADRDRLAVQGTSYGGYAVNLLVTQTDRFAAAVNVSGKVNMVSFYTDSPRLGTRNTHAPEASQDRIGGTLWEEPQKYLAHSAVLFADRIKTPMLLIGGDQDHNVPNRQLMEMYYALRRLGKDVTWVSYVHAGHGLPTTDEAMVRDYYQRILDFYAEHLAPEAGEATTPAAIPATTPATISAVGSATGRR
jgi:dipeptidyl aminopeptidase/acylaminoacyl peptidase